MKLLVNLFLAAILLAGCARSTPGTASDASPTPDIPRYLDPTQPVEARVEDLLSRMTLEEKIGQMTQPENNSIPPADVKTFFIGSVLSGGGGISQDNSLQDWTDLAHRYQEQALQTRLAIPILFGVDSVHGFNHVNGATIFPHNIGLGATRDVELVRQIGQATAEEMLAAGIHWNFAPVVAVPQDVRWGRTYEGFGEDTTLVTELSVAYIDGFQSLPDGHPVTPGQEYWAAATAKHFLGDGGTIWASSRMDDYMLDQGNLQANEETLRRLYLTPYVAAVDQGVLSVMASFSSWRGIKMHAQQYLLTEVLKDELGFKGMIVSDWGGIDQIDADYYTAVVTAINAGIDMNMVPYDYRGFIATMQQAVENGDIPEARIDDAVRRILRVKFLVGLFENPYGDPALAGTVRSEEHRDLARQAVRESLVLLRNENDALPIDPATQVILVAGEGASSTGLQSGGWTLEWQGVSGSELQGTTLLDGILASAAADSQVLYSNTGIFPDFSGTAPVGIVVVAELPYAEGVGDAADIGLSAADIELIQNVRPLVDRLVVVILSGRPKVITGQYLTADAWVAAWLPGSEGDAVAQVLFGEYPFTGTLPYSWPRSNEQLPLNINNSAGSTGCEAPLFSYGYGLGQGGSQPIGWIDCP
jgi:beta-glucosidase